jgi:hypothetical protein
VKAAESLNAGTGESDSELHRWMAWALDEAGKLNPLKSTIE